ncbi:MAG: transporter ATP-binding protein [Acidimicrobiales bacterium]|nr:transporter ATP-binding protein [Acidimicrobiales bacterium]
MTGPRVAPPAPSGRPPSAPTTAVRGSARPAPLWGGDPVLVGRDLLKEFGTIRALGGVSLTIGRGEAIAAMGPSGSGKSTLLHCLAGIEPPDRGEVWLGDERIDRLDERRRTALRRRGFGFVFQSGHLLPELHAVENVALPLMLGGIQRRAALAEARRWFAPLGIQGLEGRVPGELSGGQAQRVTIARALVTKPAVVFADEPTAALDRATGRDVVSLLVASTRASGAGLLVVTHDPEVARACDRIVVLRDGVIQGGSATELVAAPEAPGARR